MQDPLANIVVGMTGEAVVVVTPEITVGGHVPGMPMVYGTPFMIFLMEIASGRAIWPHLPEGFVSVGCTLTFAIWRRRRSDVAWSRPRASWRRHVQACCSP